MKSIVDKARLMVGGDSLTQPWRTEIAQAVLDLSEALAKIERLDVNLAANSEYDRGLMVAHSCTGTIARAALKKVGVGEK